MPTYVDENQLAARILWAATNTAPKPGQSPQKRLEHAARAYRAAEYMRAKSDEELTALAKAGSAARWGDPDYRR